MPEVEFPVEVVGGMPVVAVPEEIDITIAGSLRAALLAAAARGHGTFVVDMLPGADYFAIDHLSVGGDIGFSVTPYVALTPAPVAFPGGSLQYFTAGRQSKDFGKRPPSRPAAE